MKTRHTVLALAAMSLLAPAVAQQDSTDRSQRVEITGSLIKRTDKETASVVQSITREDIRNSGYTTIEELLRSNGAVDTSSISDGASSGFVGGVATISLRGLGSQGTLILINGRRTAPVAAVDFNFGRGSLVSVNTIPKGAIERVDILKDGASSLYGSEAIAGVVNYILRKDYQGAEGTASYTVNDRGAGATTSAGVTFGFGNIAERRFNVFGGLEVSKRDQVMHSELADRGDQVAHDRFLNATNSLSRFTADSSASFYGNYYRVPASLAGSTTIGGISVANNNLSGANYLGTLAGCPDERTVGKGVPNRPAGFIATTASLRDGFCRFNFDNADEAIAAQEKINGMLRGTYAISNSLTAYADLMLSRTKTTEQRIPYAMTTTLVTTGNRTGTTWPTQTGFRTQDTIILPVGHPDNPTNGTATAQPVQLIYRFEDLPLGDITTLQSLRLTMGLEGSWGPWDFDTALLYSKQDNKRVQEARVRSSLLTQAIASGSYRFGKINGPEAIASVSSDAVNEGDASIIQVDLRASRELFSLPGGKAAVAMGVEARNEKLQARPDAPYVQGDYIGLVANAADGSRNTAAVFAEMNLPVFKVLELLAALRAEKYSDFGNATTGKLGFKWSAVPTFLAFRGTAATGFRAPSISQIGDGFSLSFFSTQERRVIDSLRCNPTTLVSLAVVSVPRDCNVLGFTTLPTGTVGSGQIPTSVTPNKNLQPEKSNSATLGLVLQPTKDIDLALDAWYFERNGEIRVQRPIDLVDNYNANPAANAAPLLRNPNPETWLPGIPNSGPIVALERQYGNFQWTRTSGLDYDLNVRFPDLLPAGRLSVNLSGTWTRRFDQLVLAGGTVQRLVGTTTTEIPKSRGSLTVRWKTQDWNTWIRGNHTDQLSTTTTTTCLTSTATNNVLLREADRCLVGKEKTLDLGVSYKGFKGLTLAGSVLNAANNFNRSNGFPGTFTFLDQGLSSHLGRRFNLNVNYEFN